MIPFLHRATPQTMRENPLWLIVLADMMTNLMLFFLIMFATVQQGPAAQRRMARAFGGAAPETVLEDVSAPAFDRQVRETEAASRLRSLFKDVTVTEHMIRVRLPYVLLFKVAGTALFPAADAALRELAGVLKGLPNDVVVEGHTDPVPIAHMAYKSNWELSVARSYSVIERLVSEGVPAARLVASGYGEYHPIAGNEDEEGRARNRRVELVILRGE